MKSQPKTLGLFIFIDAFGWEILKKHPFLDDFLKIKTPLNTVFGYSSTCDPTILTGKMPADHGHFSFFCFDPPRSPFKHCRWLSLLPRALTHRGRVRYYMSKALKKMLGYTGYFQIYNFPFHLLPLFDYSEKRDLYEPDGINNGCPTVFDHLRERGIPYYLSDWRKSEEFNLQTAGEVLSTGEAQFGYLYMAAMDAVLHKHGTDAREVSDHIRRYEDGIRGLLERISPAYDQIDVFIFSDHGMTDIHAICDLIPAIEKTGLVFGKDYAAVYDSTMARFWFPNPSARKILCEALAQSPHGEILDEETLTRWGCNFPDRRYGELFFLLKPGVLLCPSFLGEKPLKGMHGYSPEDKDSVAMFASNITPNCEPRGLQDLYALMMSYIDKIPPGKGASA